MAKPIFGLIMIISFLFIAAQATEHEINPKKSWFENICHGKEKVAEIHFYLHNIVVGPSQTSFEVAHASITSNSPTSFGKVGVVDDLLTAGPDINSEPLGRAQGLVAFADLQVSALAMNLNFVFTSGKYNGSTISILGRNALFDNERELSVVGGTGVFRFARGYAIMKTYSIDPTYFVPEYTLYVTYVDDSDVLLQPAGVGI